MSIYKDHCAAHLVDMVVPWGVGYICWSIGTAYCVQERERLEGSRSRNTWTPTITNSPPVSNYLPTEAVNQSVISVFFLPKFCSTVWVKERIQNNCSARLHDNGCTRNAYIVCARRIFLLVWYAMYIHCRWDDIIWRNKGGRCSVRESRGGSCCHWRPGAAGGGRKHDGNVQLGTVP